MLCRMTLVVPALLALSVTSAAAQQLPVTWRADVVSEATSPPAYSPAPAPVRLEIRQQPRTRRWEGALVGAAVGAAATYWFLHSGGSTSLCDRERNQDAIRANECAAITVAGGVAGGAIGFVIGGRIRR